MQMVNHFMLFVKYKHKSSTEVNVDFSMYIYIHYDSFRICYNSCVKYNFALV
jgi:hypothetical protein